MQLVECVTEDVKEAVLRRLLENVFVEEGENVAVLDELAVDEDEIDTDCEWLII